MRTRVDLPAPFWPSSACTSPLRTQSVASLRTVTPPNFFETCRSSSASVPSLPGPGCWPASGMQDPGHGPETVDGTGQDDGRGRRGLPLLKIVLDLRGRPDEADRFHHGGRDGGRRLLVPACQGKVANGRAFALEAEPRDRLVVEVVRWRSHQPDLPGQPGPQLV